MSNWIDANKKMPEYYVPVLVYAKFYCDTEKQCLHKHQITGWYTPDKEWIADLGCPDLIKVEGVTHWKFLELDPVIEN